MNIKALSIVLVGGALALSSCSGGGSSTADNLKDAAPGDSLLYYFGQIQAAEYWRQAESDTTLRDEKSREDFMRGVKAGMDAVRSEDAYNQGVYLGVQMAMQIKESEEAYGIRPIWLSAASSTILRPAKRPPTRRPHAPLSPKRARL